MKRKVILSSILIMIIILSLILIYPKKENKVLKNQSSKKNNFLSIMIEEQAGTGKYNKTDGFPQTDYVLNSKLSKCLNGSKINYENGSISVIGNKADRCYVYFDYDALGSLCRNQNMAECFIKNYKKDDSIIYHDGVADYEGMANSELEASDLSYRYSGANNIVNNYVCLDGTTTIGNCTSEDELYRIIGLFLNEDGQYEIKLIKYRFATGDQAGGATVGAGLGPTTDTTNQVYRWNQFRNNSGTNYNNWQDSNLNTVNLNTYFYNYMFENISNFLNIVEKHSWIIGGLNSKTFNVKNAKNIYDDEVGTNRIKIGDNSCYLNDNTTNLRNCEKDDVEYSNYFGLMYLNDYMYGASPANWNLVTYDDETQNDYRLALNNDWLAFPQSNEWVITRDSSSYNTVLYPAYSGQIRSTTLMYSYSTIRPSFYIKSSIKLIAGDGTKTNPYRLNLN